MRLREIMTAKGVTIAQLSKLSGVSARTIEQYSSGRYPIKNARAYILLPIAEALNVHPKELMDEVAE